MEKQASVRQGLFVPHRIVKVGQANTDGTQQKVAADTVADPVGRNAIARATEAVRDVPKREKIIKVGLAGETNSGHALATNKVPSMLPPRTGDIYPGDHRYAYQLDKGDRIINLRPGQAEVGSWIRVDQVEIDKVDGEMVNVKLQVTSETGYLLTVDLQPNAQIRLVTDQENPHG